MVKTMMATGARILERFIVSDACDVQCADNTDMKLDDILILVINLDRAPERLSKITAQLEKLGLPWERVPAVDGKTLSMEDQSLLDTDGFGKRHGKSPLPGELGCYVSHVHAFQRFAASTASYALILEDDVELRADLPDALKMSLEHADTWDILKLSGVHHGTPITTAKLEKGFRMVSMLSKCTGASAYLVNRRAVNRMKDDLLPMRVPFDHEFDRGWHWKIKVRYLLPYPCQHDEMVSSTINLDGVKGRRFHWIKRLPAFAWRFNNASRRLVYSVLAWRPGIGWFD